MFWTDLNVVTTRINVLTDGVNDWVVAEISGRIFGSGENGIPLLTKTMQVWLQAGDRGRQLRVRRAHAGRRTTTARR